MEKQRIDHLLEKQLNNTASDAEREELLRLMESTDKEVVVEMIAGQIAREENEPRYVDDATMKASFHQVMVSDKETNNDQAEDLPVVAHRVYFLKTAWFRYAAAVLFLLAIGAYLWLRKSEPEHLADTHKQSPVDIQPGKQGAVLTLADGTKVVLDSLGDGVIADQNGVQAVLNNGQLAYRATGNGGDAIAYNTMSTPKGRQFHVTLPDGTIVWLNAASSISYPTVFKGNERKVKIQGEAYFEVAGNAKMPFRVNVDDRAQIEVLGTHFNVDAYDNNKALNTTLLEGSIKVNGTIIKSGQQAQITDVLRVVDNADISKVMAWKNGLFNFEGATLDEVMKQLERWYDIEVVYEKGIPDIEFGGEMTKNISLNGLLLVLKESDIHFRLEGRKLVVLP